MDLHLQNPFYGYDNVVLAINTWSVGCHSWLCLEDQSLVNSFILPFRSKYPPQTVLKNHQSVFLSQSERQVLPPYSTTGKISFVYFNP